MKRIKEIDCPVKIIIGGKSSVPLERGVQIMKAIDDDRRVILTVMLDCGDWPMVEKEDDFLLHIVEFVEFVM